MPFSSNDAIRHKKNLSSSDAQARWAAIANRILAETGNEGKAIRIANSQSQGSSPAVRDSVERRMKRKGFPSG